MRFGLLYTHLAHIAYMLQQTTDIVETTVLVKFKGLTIFSTKTVVYKFRQVS